jgi:uncharacterized membrane protein YbhN (UPF0104 family)
MRLRESQLLNRLGMVLSVTIIAIAAYVLYNIIKDIDVDELVAALTEIDPVNVALAAGFVVLGYFTLTFYDLFALRTIGRNDVPYRIAALAGFTSYSIGHNVGASAFTGGAVRYRIYSAWNLDAVEVAKLCFVAGLTFWLGNMAVLGLGVLYHPEAAAAIDQLPPWVNRAFAAVIVAVLVGYVVWVWIRPRNLGGAQFSVMLPGGPLTLLQIVIGIVDLAFCALAMYMLVPDEPWVDFITVAVIFVSATLLGFASHSPGGLGVFDAAMMVGLWQFDKEELLAGLLLFRVLYYLAPFVISLGIMAVRELFFGVKAAQRAGLPAAKTSAVETKAVHTTASDHTAALDD